MDEHYNLQSHGTVRAHAYCLMPGDGTRYEFGFFWPDEVHHQATVRTLPSETVIQGNRYQAPAGIESDRHAYQLFMGIGNLPHEYVFVWIRMPSGENFAIVPLHMIHRFDPSYYQQLRELFPNVYIYSLIAVTLALHVLLVDPADLSGATEAMLHAPDLCVACQKGAVPPVETNPSFEELLAFWRKHQSKKGRK